MDMGKSKRRTTYKTQGKVKKGLRDKEKNRRRTRRRRKQCRKDQKTKGEWKKGPENNEKR